MKLKLLAIIVSVSVHANELHKAVSEHNMFAIERILNQKGFENIINQRDDNGQTPLSIAVEKKDRAIVQMLVNAGADINVQNNNGDTPFHLAAQEGCTGNIMWMLLKRGVNINIRNVRETNEQAIQLLGGDVNSRAIARGYTPLHIATENRNIDKIAFLLEHGADVDCSMNNGDTALHIAVESNNIEIVKLLLAYGADMYMANKRGDTPLSVAIIEKNENLVRLLATEVQVSIIGRGATPLHIAISNGDIDKVELLLRHGADVHCRMNSGDTALHTAVQSNNIEIVKRLLAYRADVNSLAVADPDEDMQSIGLEAVTPLMGAVACGNIDLVKLLLEHGANPTIGTNGWNIFRMISFAFERQNDPLSPEKRATCKAILCLCVEWVRNNFKHDPEIRKIIGDVVERYDLFPALLSVVVLSSVPGKLSNE